MRSEPRHPGALHVAVLLVALVAAACGGSAAARAGTSTPSSALTNTTSPGRTNTTSSGATNTASSEATTTASPTPVPSASATTGEVATLTNGSRGTTTYVRADAVVDVTLTSDAGYTFTAPTSSDQSVLRRTSSSQTAAAASAEFRALQPGNATISSVENPTCLPLCGLPSRLWEATVAVTPHPVP